MQKETVSVLVENLEKRQRALKVSEVDRPLPSKPHDDLPCRERGEPPLIQGGKFPPF